MKMTYLKLQYAASEQPGLAEARIILRDNGYAVVEGHVAITSTAAGLTELEDQIYQLQYELEQIRKQAAQKFRATKLIWAKGKDSR